MKRALTFGLAFLCAGLLATDSYSKKIASTSKQPQTQRQLKPNSVKKDTTGAKQSKLKQEEAIIDSLLKSENHPLSLTPKRTVRLWFAAWINRDIDVVMAYLPQMNPERMMRIRSIWEQFMTDKRHIKRIVEISPPVIKPIKGGGHLAKMKVKVETTPKFHGKRESKTVRVFDHVFFKQHRENGPWLFDGGF